MKKKIFMSAAKKARIALAVMAVCGFTLAGAQSAFAVDPSPTTEHPIKIDDKKNIICGEGATASRNPNQQDDGTNIVVIGNNATGIGSETIAIGYNAKAEGEYSIAFGSSSYAFYGGVSIGNLSETTYGAVAIGLRAKGSGRDSVAIGIDAKAAGQDSLAIAYSSSATGKKSVALGYQAKAAGETSIAMGYRSSAEAKGSFALGSNSSVTKENSVAIGTGSVANRDNSVSVGSGGSEYYGPQYRQIINVAYGTSKNDAVTYGQILRDTWSTIKIDDDGNGSTKLTKNDGTQGPTINVDASSLNKKITKNTNSITAVDNKIGSLSADGNYIKKDNNVSKNLSALDTQVKANADDIIAANTKITAVDNKIGSLSADGNYIKKANNVSANLVELDNQVNANAAAITNKANLDLSNISTAGKDVIINLAGNKAGEIVDVKLGAITSTHYVSASGKVNANISALDTQLNKVDNKIGTMTDGNYISAGNTVAGNLSALDNQLKANAEAINTKADKDLSNITDAGKNVIKDLAGNKAGEVVDAKLGNITSENYVKKDDTVNANISALDKQMKVNTDNIGDTGKLNDAGLGSNLSDAVVNVNNKVGTAEELKALKDAGLGDNLAQATAAVNKKADKNAEDIKTVNGRVDELGGRVDTLGGAVSKLDTKVNKVGAGAAALAALHPMDFDSDNKLTFAAGVGSYHGASAAAIGAFYRPSEQVMFSISGNMGNGENMVNAGVSFALDRPRKTPTTKAALVKTVAAQNEQIAALSETVAEQNEKIARLEAMVEKLAAKQNA